MADRNDGPDAATIARAAGILRRGGLVGFPTETVYGLGADATNDAAVGRLFAVKGRPRAHPLIVHLGDASQLDGWAASLPPAARMLAARFWPGPLTLIVPAAPHVSRVVTGGLDTVGLRVPEHPVARSLIAALGTGIAAPSANRFGATSPTTAAHVRADLGSDVEFVLDGGPSGVGIESTIVDVSSGAAKILRPGGVTAEALESALGCQVPWVQDGLVRSPGQLPSHYAPRAVVLLSTAESVADRAVELAGGGRQVGILVGSGARPGLRVELRDGFVVLELPNDDAAWARELYAALREVDARALDVVLVVPPAERGLGVAILDRLRRAAAPRDR